MAYNNPYFTPYGYPQNYGVQPPIQQPATQYNGIVSVQNEQEARMYPVEPGKSVTFCDETAPYLYTKTMGRTQFDRPVFTRYRIVKEDDTVSNASEPSKTDEKKTDIDLSLYALKDDLKPILTQINNAVKDIQWLKEKVKKKPQREANDYDE